jgi:hypothetical protein
MALLLFSLVLPVFSLSAGAADLEPLSRKHEYEADAYAASRPPPATWSPRWSSSTATTPPR